MKQRQWIALVLSVLLALPLLAQAEPVTIEVFEGINVVLPVREKDSVLQAIEEALGIRLEMNTALSGTDYRNMLNVRIAGDDMPDVMWMLSRSDLVKNAKEGTILDLTPYLDQLGDVVAFLGEDNMRAGYYGGKLYALSKAPNIPYGSYHVRADWLESLNLTPPETVEEWVEMLRAFTFDDPDGNGLQDTYGLTSAAGAFGAFTAIFGGYGIGMPSSLYMKDGQLTSALYEERMPDALRDIHDLVDMGVVDPELFTITDANILREKCFQGRIGVFYDGWVTLNNARQAILTVNPNARWTQIASPKGEVSQLDLPHAYYASGLLSLSADLADDPAKLEAVLGLFNFLSRPEGNDIVSYGVEGVHYNRVDGKVVPTELMASEGGYFWAYQLTGRPEIEYLSTKFNLMTKEIEFASQLPRLRNLESFVIPLETLNMADTNRFIEEEMIKFIFGQRDIGEYEKFLEALRNDFGYNVYLEDAAAQLKEMGF